MNKCKILFLAANPDGTNHLALDEESREIETKIRASEHRDSLDLITKWAVRADDLLQNLNQYKPKIVHFSGHGSSANQIILLDSNRQAKAVSKAALKLLFSTLKDDVRVVVLNACYSKRQAEAITEVIDCAVGMKREIGDKAAIIFAAAFYRAIGFGRSVQDAFDQGKTALMLEGIDEVNVPQLIVAKGIDPRKLILLDRSGNVVTTIEFTLDRPLTEFDEGKFKEALKTTAGVDVTKIRIASIRPGSTIVSVTGEAEILAQIINALKKNEVQQRFAKATGLQKLEWEIEGRRYELVIYPLAASSMEGSHHSAPPTATLDGEFRNTPIVTDLVVERLRDQGLANSRTAATAVGNEVVKPLEATVADALQRDLLARYEVMIRRSLFPEFRRTDFETLAQEIMQPAYSGIAASLRRRILLRAARSAALRKSPEEAQSFLKQAQSLAGDDSDLLARARLAEAQGQMDFAIRLLRDEHDADSISTLLHIVMAKDGPEAARRWFSEERLTVPQLTGAGLNTLVHIYIQQRNLDSACDALLAATESQIAEAPNLLLMRAVFRLARLLPKPDQQLAIHGLPLTIRSTHTIESSKTVITELDAAIFDLGRVLEFTTDLDLPHANRNASGYLLWCQFLHPLHRATALERLRIELAHPKTALKHLQFAFAFDSQFDAAPIAKYLEGRAQFGGLDDEELQAYLILRLHGDDARAIADLISRYRHRFEAGFSKEVIVLVEIQALTQAKDAASAKLVFDENKELFPNDIVSQLEAEIAKAEGADPVLEDMRVYDRTKAPETLRSLVRTLVRKKDYRAIARYGEELYRMTRDPDDITMVAQALVNLGDGENFIRIIEEYPFLLERDEGFHRHYGWELFYSGRLNDAVRVTGQLRNTESRDIYLEIALGIESGEWETLAQPLDAFVQNPEPFKGKQLIQAAKLAQIAGFGQITDLIKVAVEKGGNDPNVWVGAYMLVIQEGLEDRFPEAQQWFNRGLDLSGEDGPIKRFELKELLPQQVEWNERVRRINQSVLHGDIPLIVAAPGLRTTLVDVVLRNLVRNSVLVDGRKRVPVPLFTGSRLPARFGQIKRLAFDVSSLLVLGWLGLLEKTFDTLPEIVLAASTLHELFEARGRIRELQKSRIKQAKEIHEAIARGQLKILGTALRTQDKLASEVGDRLATLIASAEQASGVVVRPGPIHKPGLDFMQADVSEHVGLLSDMHSLLSVLVDLGAVDQVTEEAAKRYFTLQDSGLTASVKPEPYSPVFLDDLALTYLQHTNLLGAVLNTFKEAFIHPSTAEDAHTILDYDAHIAEVLTVLDRIRNAVRRANKEGRIFFAPQRSGGDEIKGSPSVPTLHLLSNLCHADAIVFDDRALNKEPFAQDQQGHRVPCLTTLDVIEELHARGILSANERRKYRHELRISGALLVPVDAEEITLATLRSRKTDSNEFRAIRESTEFARFTKIPLFPQEIPWFALINTSCKTSLMNVWKSQPEKSQAEALSDLILYLRPKAEDWIAQWTEAPPHWIDAATRIGIASLAIPIELNDETASQYNDWLERRVLEPLRSHRSAFYQTIIEQLKEFIIKVADGTRNVRQTT